VPRRLGQHFLRTPAILERIACEACPEDADLVLEIGPGQGALTEYLLARARRVVAIEIDPAMAAILRQRFGQRLELVEADILATDLAAHGPAWVAGNLPYYITSPIIERTLALGPLLRQATFLVQKEVADRLASPPGNRDYGYLSVAVQAQCDVKRLFTVKPAAFNPPPKVDSAVVRLLPRPLLDPSELPAFLAFASACFRHKRKTLRNNVPALAGHPEASQRAEQLSVAELIALHRRLPGGAGFQPAAGFPAGV
jgi:16S rRNA (adenine1518-N6/adenine1519-N6)-dimethyltransferase